MIGKAWAFIVCCIALALPWRLRVIFSSLMGWLAQGLYFLYAGLLNYIVRELRKSAGSGTENAETGKADRVE